MRTILFSLAGIIFSLALAPLLSGIINRVKAKIGGRKGRPLLQLYYDLAKLVQKQPVYPITTSWVFRLGPVVAVACSLLALTLVPIGSTPALMAFSGDFFFLAGLFALSRFALMLAALDTGSAFEGMGTAREALFSTMAEPVFILCIAVLAYKTENLSLSGIFLALQGLGWGQAWPFFLTLAFTLYLVMLTENSRMPVDDPTTHLELTMIHEVMALDHSGPDLALVEYASILKMWIFGLLLAGILAPLAQGGIAKSASALVLSSVLALCIPLAMAIITGILEATIARLRMERVPQLLTLAGVGVTLAAIAIWR